MRPEDDPEARIRDLERPLNDVARNSELGVGAHDATHGYVAPASESYPPPLPGAYPQTAPWDAQFPPMSPMSSPARGRAQRMPVVIAVLSVVIAGGVSLYLSTKSVPSDLGNPDIAGGGATLTGSPPAGPETPPPGAGVAITVAGIGQHRTIDCNETVLSISGMDNTVTVTGHCASLSVSGMDNTVTVDSAASIGVSGFDNRIVFHVGEPQISNSGSDNTVDRR
jgi:hypothetical protein